MDPQGIKWVGSGARPETIGLFGCHTGVYLVLHSKSIFGQVNLCKVLILNTCRCGEMADATDLKSVLAKSEVWVRIPSSAPSETGFYEGKFDPKLRIQLRTL